MTAKATRLSGIAGVASFTLIIVAALVSPPLWEAPSSTASAAEIVDYSEENRGRIIAALFIYSLGMGVFLVFAAGLWSWFRRTRPGSEALTSSFAFGAVALAALIFAAFGTSGAGVYRLHGSGIEEALREPALVKALNDLTFYLLALSGIPTAVCLGAYAALVLRGGGLPAWTGWLAVLGALTHVVIAASLFAEEGFFSLEGGVIVAIPATFFVWILAAGASLARAAPPD